MQNTEYKIDKNIPAPTKWSRKSGLQAVIRSLSVGESFFAKNETQHNMSSRCFTAKLRSNDGRDYTTKKATEDGVVGTRVWRTA